VVEDPRASSYTGKEAYHISEPRAYVQVDFETIKNDRTGLFMEGGPYLL